MSVSNPRAAPFAILNTEHGAMIVNVNDRCTVGNGAEFGVGSQLIRTSHFDPEQVMALKGVVGLRRHYFGDGVLCIDCGANIGVFTIELAKLMAGWGRVISIEAQEFIYYALSGNIAINNCFNAHAVLAAVGDRDGIMKIPVLNYSANASFGSLELKRSMNEYIGQNVDYSETSMVDVRLMRIDALGLRRVDVIKIDIEGMELEALNGSAETIAKAKPICYVELYKSDAARIHAFFAERGYRSFPVRADCLYVHENDPCLKHIQATAP
jgi:FkbM family methyltransferase